MTTPTDTGIDILSDFSDLPWCRDLFSSPLLRAVPTPERRLPDPNPTHSNTFFASTLRTPEGVRAVQSFITISSAASSDSNSAPQHVKPSSSPSALPSTNPGTEPAHLAGLPAAVYCQPVGTDWILLYSLGTGLNGPAGIVHGGFIMAMLDVCMALRSSTHAAGLPVLTIAFEMEFVKMIKAPCVIMARGRVVVEEEDGKFIGLTSELVDGQEQILARAKARFRVKKPKPTASGKL